MDLTEVILQVKKFKRRPKNMIDHQHSPTCCPRRHSIIPQPLPWN